MPIFEATLKGFDGSTDKTDDHIKWIEADCIEAAEIACTLKNWDLIDLRKLFGLTTQIDKDIDIITLRQFYNVYNCYYCETEWDDYWDCGVDDECPECHRINTPTTSKYQY